jgi:hypothetical protein
MATNAAAAAALPRGVLPCVAVSLQLGARYAGSGVRSARAPAAYSTRHLHRRVRVAVALGPAHRFSPEHLFACGRRNDGGFRKGGRRRALAWVASSSSISSVPLYRLSRRPTILFSLAVTLNLTVTVGVVKRVYLKNRIFIVFNSAMELFLNW